MDRDFWLERWAKGETAFHMDVVHPHLEAHVARLCGPGDRVLVPLCGKSKDLLFLAGRSRQTIGVDLSETAALDVLTEHGGTVATSQEDPFLVFRTRNLVLMVGDFFDLDHAHVGTVDAAWDRAATVALPPSMRDAYVARLRRLVRPGGRILLNHFAYDQAKMDGPPFSVDAAEIERHYGDCRMELLEDDRTLPARFAERGLASLRSSTRLITLP